LERPPTERHDASVTGTALCFEDFVPGRTFSGSPRHISRADIDAFTVLSGDHTALHSDDEYARTTPLGGVVAHGALVLSVATGLAYALGIFEGTVLAVRSMDVTFERPVRPDESVVLQLTVIEQDPRPKADRGWIRFRVDLLNAAGKTTMGGTWTLLMRSGAASIGTD
jgi:acyl dehydratase